MPVPDEEIHPVATGAAASLVAARKTPVGKDGVKFYSGWFCPFNQRTWMALEEKAIPYEYVEINPYKKEPSFLKLNPKGLVPCLESNGIPLAESSILVEFLEDAYPSTRKLLPDSAEQKALARMRIDLVAKKCVPAYMRLLQAQTDDAQREARVEYAAALKEFASYLDSNKGPLHGGKDIDAVDIALAPWAGRQYIIENNRGGKLTAEETGEKYQAWYKAILSHPTLLKTMSDAEHYEPIYGRYLRDEAQSEAAKALRAGRVIP